MANEKYGVSVYISTKKRAMLIELGSGLIGTDDFYKNNTVYACGGVAADYTIYRTNDDAIGLRLSQPRLDEFDAVLDGGDNVTSLNFTVEDDKLHLGITVDASGEIELEPDGTYSTLNITAKVYESDGTTLDTSYQGTVDILGLNSKQRDTPIRIEFTNGVKTWLFKPVHRGTYKLPIDGYRTASDQMIVKEQASILCYHKAGA